ncbi:MAG: hypothetical protein V1736_06710 [Pseudomonadota bacterium]
MEKDTTGRKDMQPQEAEALFKQVSEMSVAEKIKLALTGGKEARGLLIRDGNKLIQMGVARNPRLTDLEAIQIAKMKSLDQTVLRHLATDRKWLKIYSMKVELVKNPKTPPVLALKLITHLRDADLRQIAKANDVLKEISLQAFRMLNQKK